MAKKMIREGAGPGKGDEWRRRPRATQDEERARKKSTRRGRRLAERRVLRRGDKAGSANASRRLRKAAQCRAHAGGGVFEFGGRGGASGPGSGRTYVLCAARAAAGRV